MLIRVCAFYTFIEAMLEEYIEDRLWKSTLNKNLLLP